MADVIAVCDNINQNLRMGFAALSQQMSDMAINMRTLQTGMDRLETRMDRLETRMDRLETRMDRLETRMGNVEVAVNQNTVLLQKIAAHLGITE